MIRFLFLFLFKIDFKSPSQQEDSKRTKIYLSNYSSYLDVVFLSFYLPKHTKIFIDTKNYPQWIQKYLKKCHRLHINLSYRAPVQKILNQINYAESILLFPEGKISETGNLNQIEPEFAQIAYETKAQLIPIHIDTRQVRSVTKLIQLFKKINSTIRIRVGEAFELIAQESSQTAAQKNTLFASQIFDALNELKCKTIIGNRTLFDELILAAKINGKKKLVTEDIEFTPISYERIFLASFLLGKKIKPLVKNEDHIGVFLPNSNGFIVTFFALQAHDLIPVMLNYSLSGDGLLKMIQVSQLKCILTSKLFIKKAKLESVIEHIKDHVTIIYLDDIKKNISLSDKISAKMKSLFPKRFYDKIVPNKDASKTCVILYTSGTEGAPKAVLLSHNNIMSNIIQFLSYIDCTKNDVLFNVLPVFHCFGLTAGTITPLIAGAKLFIYPSPLHYKEIPTLCNKKQATIIIGTDTFLFNYAKHALVQDFAKLRYIFAGAEKIQESTKQFWMDKFGKYIYEGYGVTECAPVVSVNFPISNKPGSVGKLMPLMDYKIDPVDGIQEGGNLLLKGPNLHLGYYKIDNPKKIIKNESEWYATGDIVTVDQFKMITIIGRLKRFAKICGEMISLSSIEEILKKIWPDNSSVVLSQKDAKKGECVYLVTDRKEADLSEIISYFNEKLISKFMLPKEIHYLEDIPLLGSGKADYVKITQIIEQRKQQ